MKKRVLSILAALALVMALSIPLAVPAFAAVPVLSSITPQAVAGVPSFITGNGIPSDYLGVVFTGIFPDAPTSVTVSGTLVTVDTIANITPTSFTASIHVAAGAAHGPREVTVTAAGGTSTPLYSGILVGEFPFPANGDGGSITVGITPYYDAGGTFTITSPSATAITAPVAEGTTIWYKLTVEQENAAKFDFMGGQLSVRFPHNPATNPYVKAAGYGADTPLHVDIPEIKPGSPFVVFSPVAYTVHAVDLDGSGFLVAEVDYGSTGDNPGQINGILEGQAPTIANGSITNSLLMAGSFRLTKALDIPVGVNHTGLTRSFTVHVAGPGGYSQNFTFNIIDGVLQTPTFYDLTGLTPGSYTVSETPGSPWVASYAPAFGNVTVTSAGGENATVTNSFIPGSLQISKQVDLNGASGTGLTQDFSVTVTGPNSFSQVLTFHMVNGVVTNSPQSLSDLVPGAYNISENPGPEWAVTITNSGNVTVTTNAQTQATVTNSLLQPHTTLVSIAANPTILPAGGGPVTITVVDTNDGAIPITGAYFVLTGSPAFAGSPANMTKIADSGNNDAVMDPGESWTFSFTATINVATTFTAVGHGMAGGVDVTGPSETRTIVVSPPNVPASSGLSIGLLILAFAGGITFFEVRRRRSQKS